MHRKRVTKRVMIVEDQKATAWALAESLREEGYETLTAGSSEEALEMGIEHCDVLITDLRLPCMNGIELLNKARKKNSSLHSILITAYGSPEVMASARKAGAIRCFSKPFKVDEIKECLRTALQASRGGRAKRRSAGGSSCAREGAPAAGTARVR
ncbi:MAG: response regulator [Candidatus Eisenbacteria bacterium]